MAAWSLKRRANPNAERLVSKVDLPKARLTTLRDSNEAENEEPQPQNQRGRLTTLDVTNEAENGE